MDLGFARHEALWRDVQAAPLDYPRLVAGLAVRQSASHTAAAEARMAGGGASGMDMPDALILLLEAGPGWAGAVEALRGSFSPHVAADREEPPHG